MMQGNGLMSNNVGVGMTVKLSGIDAPHMIVESSRTVLIESEPDVEETVLVTCIWFSADLVLQREDFKSNLLYCI